MNDFREYSELYHYGIKGMHWGVRRYQNKDGSLTAEGKKKYNVEKDQEIDAINNFYGKRIKKVDKKISKAKAKNKTLKEKDLRNQKKIYEEIAKKEIKKIKNTNILELSKQRRTSRGKNVARTLLLSTGLSVALSTMLTMPILGKPGVAIVRYPRDNNFISYEDRMAIINKHMPYSNRFMRNKMANNTVRPINRRSKKKK